jgi:hypothetical protein
MTPSEAEKEFEEWWKSVDEPFFLYSTIAKKAYLEAYSRQQKEIDRLREGINLLVDYIPDGWEMPLGYNQIVNQVKKLLGEDELPVAKRFDRSYRTKIGEGGC